MSDEDWDGPDYGAMSGDAPFDKPPTDYSYIERRAEIYSMIEDAGHPRNLERNQSELADRYGVSQQQISKDMQRLREYEAAHNSTRAQAATSFLAEKAIEEALDRNDYEKAFELQREYNEYLFEIGTLESEPDQLEVSGNAGEAYMAMLREAAEDDE